MRCGPPVYDFRQSTPADSERLQPVLALQVETGENPVDVRGQPVGVVSETRAVMNAGAGNSWF